MGGRRRRGLWGVKDVLERKVAREPEKGEEVRLQLQSFGCGVWQRSRPYRIPENAAHRLGTGVFLLIGGGTRGVGRVCAR